MSATSSGIRASRIGWLLIPLVAMPLCVVAQQATETAQPKPERKPGSEANPAATVAKSKVNSGARAQRGAQTRSRRDPPGFYMGRRIAEVMSWEGADWLFRETRIDEEQPESMLDALDIPKGGTVADVGAGAGYHSIRLARRVGPNGTVLATDIQPEMLRMIQENARLAGLANIKPIRASQRDTKLPPEKVDLILLVDVYHECSAP
jgi:16S rRNA C967 or C1407 C5-methylase (RsmB/RsmF family)